MTTITHKVIKVPNDNLSLRQPVHVTSLSYLSSSIQGPSTTHLIAGTNDGHVRRYDSRAARKPVADWRSIAKAGAIKAIEDGHAEQWVPLAGVRTPDFLSIYWLFVLVSEVFLSDQASNLFALDLRAGRVLYGYQGMWTSSSPAYCQSSLITLSL
jgi:ribosome biogenesis protein NSA1